MGYIFLFSKHNPRSKLNIIHHTPDKKIKRQENRIYNFQEVSSRIIQIRESFGRLNLEENKGLLYAPPVSVNGKRSR